MTNSSSRYMNPSPQRLTSTAVYKRIPVTLLLIGINFGVYLVTAVAPQYIENLALIPVLVWHQPWRLITSAFTHAGLMHLLLNMMALASVGPMLERIYGRVRYTALYFLSAFGGSVGVMLFLSYQRPEEWMTMTVGASGAVFGLFAAFFVLVRKIDGQARSALTLLVVNLAYGFLVPGISWQGHVGGMTAGAIVALCFEFSLRAKYRKLFSGMTIGLLFAIQIAILLMKFWPLIR